ncbi:hypothetical protein [Pasteurella phage vB_PmuP_Pa7]|uniref:Uncharacterized protein n=1 Tax=Pasteurella phage vB_PmuP_Pa7 TaxID=2767198 RepID=A0A7G8ZYQ3_9CAUD|nr:hypothetical protein [Pasteurella phage vB_PmuP_Pa7]
MLKVIAKYLVKAAIALLVFAAKHNDRKARLKMNVIGRTEKLVEGLNTKLEADIKKLQDRKEQLEAKLKAEKQETFDQAHSYAEEAASLISSAQRLKGNL